MWQTELAHKETLELGKNKWRVFALVCVQVLELTQSCTVTITTLLV
jgi:hypothetical protein